MRDKIQAMIFKHYPQYHDLKRTWELADSILALLAPELDKARLYDALFPLVNRIATVSYHQINGDDGPLTTREIWEWQAEAERILYGKVGGYKEVSP